MTIKDTSDTYDIFELSPEAEEGLMRLLHWASGSTERLFTLTMCGVVQCQAKEGFSSFSFREEYASAAILKAVAIAESYGWLEKL